MENLFVSYEIAKQLKESGFNEPTLAHFNTETEYGRSNPVITLWQQYDIRNLGELPAPLIQQVIEWFDLRGIAIMHYFNTNVMEWQYIIVVKQTKSMSDNYYSSNEAILQALKLIKL